MRHRMRCRRSVTACIGGTRTRTDTATVTPAHYISTSAVAAAIEQLESITFLQLQLHRKQVLFARRVRCHDRDSVDSTGAPRIVHLHGTKTLLHMIETRVETNICRVRAHGRLIRDLLRLSGILKLR